MKQKRLLLAAAAVVAVAVPSVVTIVHADAAEAPQRVVFREPGYSNFDPNDGINDCYPASNPVPFANPANGTVTVNFLVQCEWEMPTIHLWLQIIDYTNHQGDRVDDKWYYGQSWGYAETALPCLSGAYGGYVMAEVQDANGTRSGWYSAENSVDCSGGEPGWV